VSSRQALRAITDNAGEHPAVRAWSRLRGDLPRPEAVELVRKVNSRTTAVRLLRVGRNGTSVIAKRTESPRAMVEKTMYENAARYLSMPTLHYYGCVEADSHSWWVFMEDAGDGSFSFRDDRHRLLAAHWLAGLHTSVPKLDCFPDRGIDHYHSRMTSAREQIIVNMDNKALRAEDCALLRRILSHVDLITQRWERVHVLDEHLPKSLIHGDFKDGNLRVRDDAGGKVLLVFDWEESGWGLPGVDMWRLDPESYWLRVREHWRGMTREDVLHLASVGKLLWCLKAIDWETANLAHEWLENSMGSMRVYEEHLTDAIQRTGLLR